MDNITSTSVSQISPNTDSPLNTQSFPPLISDPTAISTNEPIILSSSECEPTTVADAEEINTNENVQVVHDNIKSDSHDVVLTSVKTNGHQQNNVLTTIEHHKMNIEENDEHIQKSKSYCSMLNKLFLTLAIVCFILFLCSIWYILNNSERLDAHDFSSFNSFDSTDNDLSISEQLIDETYFNITDRNNNGIIVTLSRRGASVKNILIPHKNKNNPREYRSIVIKSNIENDFGSVRFGFNDPNNTMNVINQLPKSYPFLNYYKENWTMYGDRNNPYRVRFVHNSIEIIYEISLKDSNELIMKTMAVSSLNRQIIVDLTNNIYFNLRGYGNLSTHYLNLSSSYPMDIFAGKKTKQNRLIQSQRVDQLSNISNYFYKLDQAGIGKNYIATLFESETKITMRLFSDHTGVIIDPFGVGILTRNINRATTISNIHGIRISPRQSPVYQPMPIYGPILIVYPSETIHTTWWQFEYEH